MAVAAIGARDAGRQAVAGDLGDAARRHVEQNGVGRQELVKRLDMDASFDLAAVLAQDGRQRVRDRLRAAARDRPAEAVAGADERHANRRAHRIGQRAERVRRDAAEKRTRLRRLPRAREDGGGHRRCGAEAGQLQRVARHVQHRAEKVVHEFVELLRRREHAPPGAAVLPQTLDCRVQRVQHHPRAAVVQRVRAVDLGPEPLEPVALEAERVEERRADGHRMHGRALVVQHPGHGQLARPRAAADPVVSLEHGHLDALARERDSGGQPVRAGAHYDGAAHARAVAAGAVSFRGWTTSTGKSNEPSSHGPRLTISATSTQPSSSSPVAAS